MFYKATCFDLLCHHKANTRNKIPRREAQKYIVPFLISKFRRFLNVLFFLLGETSGV